MREDKQRNKSRKWRIVSIVAAVALLLCVSVVGVIRYYLNMRHPEGEHDCTYHDGDVRSSSSVKTLVSCLSLLLLWLVYCSVRSQFP